MKNKNIIINEQSFNGIIELFKNEIEQIEKGNVNITNLKMLLTFLKSWK